MAIRAVVFDAVGTLLYAEPDVAAVYTEAGRRFGSRLERHEVQNRFRTAFGSAFTADDQHSRPAAHQRDRQRWRQVVAEVFPDASDTEALFEDLWAHFGQAAAWRLHADVEPAWHEAQRRGWQVAIGSNYDDRLLSVVAGLPLLADCAHVFHSAGLGFAKPDLRFFRAVEQGLRLAPEEILLVGDDRVNDFLGARRAGWQALFLDRSGSGGAGTIGSLTELFDRA